MVRPREPSLNIISGWSREAAAGRGVVASGAGPNRDLGQTHVREEIMEGEEDGDEVGDGARRRPVAIR